MKKLLPLAVAFCMSVGLMSGCAGNPSTPSDPASGTPENPSSEASAGTPAADGEKVTIKYLRPGTAPEQNDALLKGINDKLAADGMNMEFDIVYVASDVFQDKAALMLSGGDEVDLIAIMEDQKTLASYIAMEGVAPITSYLDQYGANIKKVIPEWMWESATINNEIYTIPAYWTDLADQASCITIRREKLDQFGLEDPKTMDDLLNLCDVFTQKWDGDAKPVIIPMYKEPFTWLFRTLDTYPFTVMKDLVYVDQQGNVKNWLETDEFKTCAEFFRTCYEKGYVPTDILSSGWSSWNQMLTGNFIWVDGCQLWGTQEVWNERIPGCDLDSIYLNPTAKPFRPASFRNDTAVSGTSEHPADAVRFMDWMYASQDNYDLMVYGVEGLTWKDEGEGLYTKLIPDFEFNADWMIGNLNFERYEKGTYQKFIDIMGTEKPDAENSIIINFNFDPTNVATEYANCTAAVESSVYPLKLGIISYEEGYADALAKLKAAGIDTVIEEYQRQVNEYLANQK